MALLSPIFNLPYFTNNSGDPLAGGQIFAYEAGSTSVLKVTYIDQDETATNPNPIILDSAGRLPGNTAIWLETGLYNLVLTAPDGTTVLKSFDNVSGVVISAGGGGGGASGVWVETPGATFLSSTSVLVPGNFTAQYALGNRVRVTQAGGFSYGVVTSVSFGGGNTTVVVQLDGPSFNPSVSKVEYSLLFAAPNETVDAGGVSYFDALSYPTANTVGNKVKTVDAGLTAVTNRVGAMRQVWPTSGTGTYAVTVSPAVTSYSTDQLLTVRFQNAHTGPATININGVGAVGLVQFNSAGTLGDPVIAANQVSDIAYNGSVFIVLDSLAPAAAAVPRGMQVFTSNGVFTTPAGVSFIKVTCIGGGGGGASSWDSGSIETPTITPGGAGGGGVTASRVISTSPGTTYTMTVGVGGAGGNGGALPWLLIGYPGGNGGSTSFGVSLVSASGGQGGTTTGGAGGSGGTGDFLSNGMPGGLPVPGGTSAMGGGSFGAGGSGAPAIAFTPGQAGAPGVIIVDW